MITNETLNPTRSKYVEIAKKYEGIKEGTAEHKKLIDEYNRIQDKITASYRMPWCACFVSLINVKSGGNKHSSSFPNQISTSQMVRDLQMKGRYVPNNVDFGYFIPQQGDTVFFDYDTYKDGDHVGIVVNVTSGNNPTITVLEGNRSNMVKRVEYKKNDKSILGYGLPRFKSE